VLAEYVVGGLPEPYEGEADGDLLEGSAAATEDDSAFGE
jgi:hypothetical protein